MVDCKVQKNKTACTCSYTCGRKGLCCECVSYHRSRNEVPACFFPVEVERMYDRSIETFIDSYRNR